MTPFCTPKSPRLSLRFLRLLLLPSLLTGCVASGTVRQAVNPAEKTVRVSGYVLDSVSRKPVAGVFVQGNFFGTPRTDAQGHFVLHLPVNKRKPTAQVVVSTVLYQGNAVIPADTSADLTILLRRRKRQLPPDDCAGVVDSLRMNPYAVSALALPGKGLGFFIENTSGHTADTLKAIILDREGMNLDWGNYWVVLYAAPSPGQELRAIVEQPYGVAIANAALGRQYFDFKSANILIPPGGFILELTFVPGCDKCPMWITPVFNHLPTGPLLAPPCLLADAKHWLFEYSSNSYSKRRLTPAENPAPLYHNGLQVELVGHK